jgi:glyoxalase family protein
MQPIPGLHHITVAARDPQQNVDFYHHLLGQRLIKKTVNFDDPSTYHLYYADAVGSPGTVLTFFPWINLPRQMRGNGEAGAVAYSISPGSLGFWTDYLRRLNIRIYPIEKRFGLELLPFEDPDGMRLELVAGGAMETVATWQESPIPSMHQLQGFYGATLRLAEVEPTAELLTKHMGYRFVGQEGPYYRFQAASDGIGMLIDLLHNPGAPTARFGTGSVHHIAFRAPDGANQLAYQQNLQHAGYQVTPVRNRQYFRSIYFRSPGGVLFEIATDDPGFAIDEPVSELGMQLRLPPWLESQRPQIEQLLPPIHLKSAAVVIEHA